MKNNVKLTGILIVLITLAFIACGGGDSNGTKGADGLSQLVTITDESTGINCMYGGQKICTGLDLNFNGTLDLFEITSIRYICNGQPGPGVIWINVTDTSVQAQPNTGYLANNPTSQVVITLPPSSALSVGDILQVSGLGAGGWKIAQNSEQSVIMENIQRNNENAVWTPREFNRNWNSVASSSDGTKLVAVVYGGQIYSSVDSGISWTPREENRNWMSVASSSDGTKLVAVVYDGQIYTSVDSGISWTPREESRNWASVASSSDGTKLVATASGSRIYTSTDSGVSWTPREASRNWGSVASSSDGTKLVAATSYNDQIYTSIDSGVSWTPREASRYWTSVASSSDGTKLVAAVTEGRIYTSTNSGVSWTLREANRYWTSVSSSSDGTKLVAVVYDGGRIYTSNDSGLNWTPRESYRNWISVASSSDGTKLVAVVTGGQIYTFNFNTSKGIGGFISGNQYNAIELQYIGSDRFIVLNHEGDLYVQ